MPPVSWIGNVKFTINDLAAFAILRQQGQIGGGEFVGDLHLLIPLLISLSCNLTPQRAPVPD